jgi:phosphoribosylglycinamide formyltransferase 1
MINIAIFASGSGTNCENLIRYFYTSEHIRVALVVTNNPSAGVIDKTRNLNVNYIINSFRSDEDIVSLIHLLDQHRISWIALAGFLKLVPTKLIQRFPGKIINIHPALLPKYGGQGMYGHHVHNAVILSKDKISGITIHHVNELYDEGQIIAQFHCDVRTDDTPETLAKRIHALEYQHYPEVLEKLILKQ